MIFPAALIVIASCARAQPENPAAGGIVRSKEWKVRRAPEKEEEFIGDVSYKSADGLIRADWALYRHAEQAWKTRGHVRLDHKTPGGDAVTAQGDEAVYNQKTEKGALTAKDRVSFERRPPEGEPDSGEADRLEWEGRAKASLFGKVHVWGPRIETWSDRADYDRAAGKLALNGGRPVLRKLEGDWTGAVKADQIEAWDAPRRITADGSTKGWLEFPEKGGLKELKR